MNSFRCHKQHIQFYNADALRDTLAVPKIRCLLFASPNFDRCAFSLSLHRPQDAVKLKAANSATSAFI